MSPFWFFVPSGAGGSSYLLDDVSGAAVAYAYRLLRAAYSGYCCTVRRSSDNEEYDIAFDSNDKISATSRCYQSDVDQGAISTVFSGTDGYIKTWYDQSTNGLNASQSTTGEQPKLISSGLLLTNDFGTVGALWDGADDLLEVGHNAAIDFSDTISFYSVIEIDGFGESGYGRIIEKNSTGLAWYVNDNSDSYTVLMGSSAIEDSDTNSAVVDTTVYTSFHYDDTAGTYAFYENKIDVGNGSTSISLSTNTTSLKIGNKFDNTRTFDGKICEVILYNSIHNSTDRGKVDTNIDDFHGVS